MSNTLDNKDSLLVYEVNNNFINIGDYVQSLAARQFLEEPVLYLSREKLDLYSGAKTRLIMNGWFLYQLEHWPPSPEIIPQMISFHINSSAMEIMDHPKSYNYFKAHEPIGCRDYFTVNLLKEKGIEAYFSGCLTLTLGESYSSEKRGEKIYFVDPFVPKSHKNKLGKILLLLLSLSKRSVIKEICRKRYGKVNLSNYLYTSNFYKIYKDAFSDSILKEAEYVNHLYSPQVFKNDDEIFEEAKRLIKNYSNAKLVVTSRIHCALPCLGLQTPVIYIDDLEKDEISSCRLDGLLELFNILNIKDGKFVKEQDSTNQKISESTKITNKENYKKLKKGLINTLNQKGFFINKV